MKTKKSLFLIACLIISSMFLGHSKRKDCQGVASLVPIDQYVMLYDSPDGDIIDSIINDTINDGFVKVCIEQIQKGYAEISAFEEGGLMGKKGWAQLKCLNVSPVPTLPFYLYAHPDMKSAFMDTVFYPQRNDIYTILRCKDEWLYVRVFNGGVWREGWLAPSPENSACEGGALLVPVHQYVTLYDSPYGKMKDSIINDTITEDYLSICIEQIQSDYAEVSAFYPVSNIRKEGWVQLKYLGINPAPTSLFYLYACPDEKSAIADSIPNPYWGDLYPILKCKDRWLYIKAFNDGAWREGWMAPIDQCDQPYTTCG